MPAPSILYFIHGRGRGHAARSVPVIARLRAAGFRLQVFAGGDAPAFLKAQNVSSTAVASIVPGMRWWQGALALPARLAHAALAQSVHHAELIISDGDQPSALAGVMVRVPVLAIGHGLVFGYCRPPDQVDLGAWRRERAKARRACWGARSLVAVNFLPVTPEHPGVIVAAPALRPELVGRSAQGDRVVAYFSNGDARAAAALLRQEAPAAQIFAQPSLNIPGARPPDPTTFTEALLSARAVVATAGSQLIAECVALGVPLYGLWDPGHDEQRLNIEMLRGSALGDGCCLNALKVAPLRAFLRRQDDFRAGLEQLPPLPKTADVVLEETRRLLG